MAKPKVALYWAASCGGCDIGLLEIGENLLKLIDAVDIVFWPVAMDVKYKDVEAMEDGSIDVCLFNGSIRSSEQEHIAKLLRAKSKVMIAYGACAYQGGIPGLANMYNREMLMERAYLETPSTENPDKVLPQTSYQAPEGELTLPLLFDTVKTLAQTVKVEYIIPGCPPEAETTWMALEALINGNMPPVGTVITDSVKSVCDECPRKRDVKKIKKFHRTYEIIPDPEICLLEQGLPCAGIATKGGCGARCPKAGMPCTGCYGPVDGVIDQGAHFMNAIASVIDSNDPEEIAKIIADIRDPAGTFYRYSLPDSVLRRARV
ncbi:MAG: F420-nonreducing hydrogenase [Dehalococcoidales bacterium]|nr:F420-nonreducing hydrogenase [Dehalococcoidales bacterium]MDD3994410.1 F420-nonreducing hydrogenase [Dehalococcoidales bacterium]